MNLRSQDLGPALSEPGCDGAEGTRESPRLTHADCFPLGGDDHNLLIDFDAILISENTWKHDFCPIADCIHLQRQHDMSEP